MEQDEDKTIEQRLDNISATVNEFTISSAVLGESLLTEKKWRKWFVAIALVLGIGILIMSVLLSVFVIKLQNVSDKAAVQAISNGNSIKANQEVLDQIQACNDPLSDCVKKRDALIRLAQEGIKVDTHAQIEQLREDVQSLLIQLQTGQIITHTSTTTTIPNK